MSGAFLSNELPKRGLLYVTPETHPELYTRAKKPRHEKENLYLDVDIVRAASGELRANVDFSRYVGHLAPELSRKIDAAILDSVEPQLNALGWVKERTCHQNYFRAMGCYECSACGGLATLPTKYCPCCGARVLSEEEQGHQVADAIRRLEKAVEE